LMRESGKVPSVRKVSGQLGVDPMAIYHYFKNKAALLEAVSVSLMETIYVPTGEDSWQDELRALSLSYLVLLREHSGLLETMLSMDSIGPAQVFGKRFERILKPLGLSDEMLMNAMSLLADYLHGYALAMRCNWSEQELDVDMLDGPLSLYLRGVEAEIAQC